MIRMMTEQEVEAMLLEIEFFVRYRWFELLLIVFFTALTILMIVSLF